MTALQRYTSGAAWFSNDEGNKEAIAPGQLTDLAVLSEEYFTISEERIKALESVLTIVDGNLVYASEKFQDLAPPPLPASPDWSPVKYFGSYQTPSTVSMATAHTPLHLGGCVPSAGNALNSSVINSSMLSQAGASSHFLAASVAVWVAVWDALVSSETSPKPYLWQ